MKEPIKLDKNDLKILGRMIELSEMNEAQITKADLQLAVGIWDIQADYNMFGRYTRRPSGDKAFTSSLSRLVSLGLVEQTKTIQQSDEAVFQLPRNK